MNAVCCLAVLKWKKPIPKDFPPQKTKQKFAKIFDRAREGTENDAQKYFQFPPFCVTLFDYVIDWSQPSIYIEFTVTVQTHAKMKSVC